MAELPAPVSETEYKIFTKDNTSCETNILRLIAEAYGLSSQLNFFPAEPSENDSLFSVAMKAYHSTKSSENGSQTTIEEAQGLQPIIDILARDYKAKTPSPGRKNRLILDHPWYFSGYRAIKDRVRRRDVHLGPGRLQAVSEYQNSCFLCFIVAFKVNVVVLYGFCGGYQRSDCRLDVIQCNTLSPCRYHQVK
jgi:hypothetical protein